ncbi:hypothetical protein [Ideonella sp. A 288]|uniref:hypothetical protein n=1 Tax=Ideonella sp. A 288 TaxID=1962181 RepID=UPI000B4B1CCE|nr:hypothetical protein [Ideonella sp. A 288]
MNTRSMRPALGALALACLCPLALAGRPIVTEDAGVLDRGACEFETFALRATQRGAPSATGLSAQVGCGVGYRSQVAVAVATTRSDGQSEHGLALVGKTALNEPGPTGPAWTLAWGLDAAKPSGESLDHESTFLNGVMSLPITERLKLHANLGWSHSQSARQSTTGWAMALERSLPSGIDLLGEVFADDRERSPWVQVGVRWAVVPDKLFVDASWGMQTSSSRPKALTIGLKAAF